MIDADLIGLSLPVRAVKSFLDLTKSYPVRIADIPVPYAIIGAPIGAFPAFMFGWIAGKNEEDIAIGIKYNTG